MDEYRIPAAGDAFTSLPGGDAVDEAPHVCNDGWITIGQMAVDPETGEETEGFAMYLCQRCASDRKGERWARLTRTPGSNA